MAGRLDPPTADAVLRADVAAQTELALAVSKLATTVSPQAAQSVQATENFWRRVAGEFGMLTAAEAGERLGAAGVRPGSLALQRISERRLIGVRRRGHRGVLVPGFQFDGSGRVFPVIADLLAVLPDDDAVDWAGALVMFLCDPNGWLPDGGRPVDLLATDPDVVLDAARREFDQDVW